MAVDNCRYYMATSATNLTAPIATHGGASRQGRQAHEQPSPTSPTSHARDRPESPHPAGEDVVSDHRPPPLVRLWYTLELGRACVPTSHTVHLELATLELNVEQETILSLSLFAADLFSQVQASVPKGAVAKPVTRSATMPASIEEMDRFEAQMAEYPNFALTVRLSALYVSFSTDAVRLAVLSARSFEVDVATCPETASAALSLGNLQLWDLDYSTDGLPAPTEIFGRRDPDAFMASVPTTADCVEGTPLPEETPVPMVSFHVLLRRRGTQDLVAAPCWGAVGGEVVASHDVTGVVELAVNLRIESIRFVMAAPFLVSAVRYFTDGPLLRLFAPLRVAPKPVARAGAGSLHPTMSQDEATSPDAAGVGALYPDAAAMMHQGLKLQVEVELISPTLVFPVSTGHH